MWAGPDEIPGEPPEFFCDELEPNFLDTAQTNDQTPLKKPFQNKTYASIEKWKVAMGQKIEERNMAIEAMGFNSAGWLEKERRRSGMVESAVACFARKTTVHVWKSPEKMAAEAAAGAAHARNMQEEQLQATVERADFGMADFESENHPLMVCFPPPGYVPIEVMKDLAKGVWSISPDPGKFVPTTTCLVRVFRVRIDVNAGEAVRVPGGEVALSSFSVDSVGSRRHGGTSFCVIFSLVPEVAPGDQFEVVLSGLACKLHDPPPAAVLSTVAGIDADVVADATLLAAQSAPATELRYFVAFEHFLPNRDMAPLRKRAKDLRSVLSGERLWSEPLWYVPEHPQFTSNLTARMRQRGTIKDAHQEAKKLKEVNFSQGAPPPIGVVLDEHPFAEGHAWGDRVISASSNITMFALVIPCDVVIRTQMMYYSHTHSKWELIPNSAFLMYVEEPGRSIESVGPTHSSFDTPRNVSKRVLMHARTIRTKRYNRRVVVRLLLPAPGGYELRFLWGLVPTTGEHNPNVNQSVAIYDHPLILQFEAQPSIRRLIDGITAHSVKHMGFPRKHPLADHFGFALLGPLRYRLRSGHVKFAVHVKVFEDFTAHVKCADITKEKPWLRDKRTVQPSLPKEGVLRSTRDEQKEDQDDDSDSSSNPEDGLQKRPKTTALRKQPMPLGIQREFSGAEDSTVSPPMSAPKKTWKKKLPRHRGRGGGRRR
jgi:hypothetical protein